MVSHGVGMATNYIPGSMRDLITKGQYYRVSCLNGFDIGADSPELAAVQVGVLAKRHGFKDSSVPLFVTVSRHWRNSSIGCAVVESLGVFPTLTPDHYDI